MATLRRRTKRLILSGLDRQATCFGESPVRNGDADLALELRHGDRGDQAFVAKRAQDGENRIHVGV